MRVVMRVFLFLFLFSFSFFFLFVSSSFAFRAEMKLGASYSFVNATCCKFERSWIPDPYLSFGAEHLLLKSLSVTLHASLISKIKTVMKKSKVHKIEEVVTIPYSAGGGVRFYPIGGKDIIHRGENYTLQGRTIKPFLGLEVGYAHVEEVDVNRANVVADTASFKASLGALFPSFSKFMHISTELSSFINVSVGFIQIRPLFSFGVSVDM
jgi:hypothetical protein